MSDTEDTQQQQPESQVDQQKPPHALWDGDRLGRMSDAEHLLKILNQSSEPRVLLLEGPWGSGKTQFLTHIGSFLENHEFSVVRINAWEEMRFANPIVSIIYAILDSNYSGTNFEEVLTSKGTLDHLKAWTFPGTILAAGAYNPIVLTLAPFLLEAKRFVGSRSKNTNVPGQLKEYRQAVSVFNKYKEMLGKELRKSGAKQTIVCIDELDRCRPEYALGMLEIIHHAFLIEGVQFVLAVNYDELSNSLTALYGHEFDVDRYLRRFVDKHMHLSRGQFLEYVKNKISSLGTDPSRDLDIYSAYLVKNFVIESPRVSARDIDQRIDSLRPSFEARRDSDYSEGKLNSTFNLLPRRIVLITMGVLRLGAPETHGQFYRARISDLQTLRELDRIANRSDDWWQDTKRQNEYMCNAVLEAVLIGWYRSNSNAQFYDTPLLSKRRVEAAEGIAYPRLVVAEADHPAYQNRSTFHEAMKLLQGDLEASSTERMPD